MTLRHEPDRHRRRSIRLKGYDYAQLGVYFLTICTQNRVCLFGQVVEMEMRINDAGQVAEECWLAILDHFPHVALDEFVIMPNHVHGIIRITDVGVKNFSPLPNAPAFRSPWKKHKIAAIKRVHRLTGAGLTETKSTSMTWPMGLGYDNRGDKSQCRLVSRARGVTLLTAGMIIGYLHAVRNASGE